MARVRSRILVLALTVACAFAAHAAPPIQQQMSPEEFRAAGLDKLNTEELARLNTWLGRAIESETAKAAKAAKQQLVEENRGFFNFGSSDPVRSTIAGEFRGFSSGRSYTLANGQVWKQVDDASLAGARLSSPTVVISPSVMGNVWYMAVGRYGTRAKVVRVK
jgi:hypothetical protein